MDILSPNKSQGDKLMLADIDIRVWLHELREIANDPQERASLRFALHQIHDEIADQLPTIRALADDLNEEADLMGNGAQGTP